MCKYIYIFYSILFLGERLEKNHLVPIMLTDKMVLYTLDLDFTVSFNNNTVIPHVECEIIIIPCVNV